MKCFRLFFGIELNDEFRDLCHKFTQEMEGYTFRWVRQENRHITLLFIGDFPVENISSLSEQIEKEFAKAKAFSLIFDCYTCFPPRKARMIWGKFHNNSAFSSLSENLSYTVKKYCKENRIHIKIPPAHEHIPHITLCRLREDCHELPELPQDFNISVEMKITAFRLYQSELNSDGAKYNTLSEFRLTDKTTEEKFGISILPETTNV